MLTFWICLIYGTDGELERTLHFYDEKIYLASSNGDLIIVGDEVLHSTAKGGWSTVDCDKHDGPLNPVWGYPPTDHDEEVD